MSIRFARRSRCWMQDENPYLPIIGVVGDVNEGSVREAAQPTVFYSHRQMAETGMTLFARTNQPTAIADSARRRDSRVSIPTSPSTRIRTVRGRARREPRARAAQCAGLGRICGQRAAARVARAVRPARVPRHRAHERDRHSHRARRAARARLTRSVVGGGLRLVAIGAAIGIGGSLLLFQLLGTLLFGVTPNDLSTYVIVLRCWASSRRSRATCRLAGRRESSH